MTMPGSPHVSVVIPAYRNGRFIDATMRSVLSQDYDDFEVVVADHSSDDDTAQVLEHYRSDPRVRLLAPTPRGGGAGHNWNRVSQESRGEYIKLVCGDDLLAPGCLSSQVALFDMDPSLVLVAGRRNLIDEDGHVIRRGHTVMPRLKGAMSGNEILKATVRAGTNVLGEPACVLMRRDRLESIGWWDARNSYYIDMQTYAQVIAGGHVNLLEDSVASFRVGGGQWSVRLVSQQSSAARRFHSFAADNWPEVITPADVRIGNARALLGAQIRRLVYAILSLEHRVRSGRRS